jgi:site-specific DNA-methyltransferase (adenine-specific)
MIDIRLGDCRDLLKTIPDGSVDCIITDPPYPEISRDYGRMTEAEWHDLMRRVVNECRRILKPSGSAVFILQPNSRKAGSMRLWPWEFMLWAAREWNMIQDAYWWNRSTLPVGGSNKLGLMRPSVKLCIWLGPANCYRNQDAVLLTESSSNKRQREIGDFIRYPCPSRVRTTTEGPRDDYRRMKTACVARGGTTPSNTIDFGSDGRWNGGTDGHPASTPLRVIGWWMRYICPPGGTILDPFMGSGSTGLIAIKYNCSYIGFEQMPRYFDISKARLDAAMAELPLFAADR